MHTKHEPFFAALGLVLLVGMIAVCAAVPAFIVMLLWNALLVGWLNWPVLDFWSALGVCTLLGVAGYIVRGSK